MSIVADELKVSKFQKQIFLFSFEPKTDYLKYYFCPNYLNWAKKKY